MIASVERRRALAVIAAALMLSIVLPPLVGLVVDFRTFLPPLLLCCVGVPFLPYLAWRGMPRFYGTIESFALAMFASFASLVLSYAAARSDMPMADALLSRMDSHLGLSTVAVVKIVSAHPKLYNILGIVYRTFSYQILFIPPALSAFISNKRSYQFLLAYVLICGATIVAGIPFPALGAIVGQGFDPRGFPHVNEAFISSFEAVRTTNSFTLDATDAHGIITFPSLHAGIAILCAWAAWPSPILRGPLLLLNILMFTSAITCGSHYFVDVIAGSCIAVLGCSIASAGLRRPSTLSALCEGAKQEAQGFIAAIDRLRGISAENRLVRRRR